MNPALQVTTLGQSLWLDNLSRSLLRDGTLARLIAENGVSGVTWQAKSRLAALQQAGTFMSR